VLARVWVIAGGDERGGAAVHLEAYARSLAQVSPDIAVEWHLLGEGWLSERLRTLGVSVRGWPKSAVRAVRGIAQAVKAEAGPLLLHAHGPRANLVARMVAARTRVPWVATVHSDPDTDFASQGASGMLRRSLNRWALDSAAGVFAVNPVLKDRFGRRGQLVPNAVWFDPKDGHRDTDRLALRARIGASENAFVVGTVARLDPVKNLPTLIRAVAPLQHQDIHLVIAGDGRQREELEALARSLAPRHVHLLGFVDDPAPVFRALDIHVLVSRSEGTGLSILEAGYYGVPSIGSDVAGIRQLIRDGQTGLLVPVGSESAIREAVLRVRDNPAWAQGLVDRFQREVLPRFQPDKLREAYLAGYRRILASDLSATAAQR
jgi:glycosyltransferase involved in cell wall biosynthesis